MPFSISPGHGPREPQHSDWAHALVELLDRTLRSPDSQSHDRAIALLRAVALPLAVVTVAVALVVLLLVLIIG